MTEIALEMDQVSKKFRRGEIHDSLRDLLPAVSKRFFRSGNKTSMGPNEFWAVRNVSFRVGRGEAFGIIGSNGAGKSTMLKMLCRVFRPTEGKIIVNGTMSALIEIGAGFHPDLTGRENIFLNGTILGMKRERIKKKFDEIVEFSGIADFIDTPVKRYSSGMYARLGFSVAAHVDPEILLVDEVLSVGDYAFQNKCLAKLRSILNEGVTVIFVSHNLRAVADMCERCILLDHGHVIREGVARDVVDAFLNPSWNSAADTAKDAVIAKAAFRNTIGQVLEFSTGDKAFLETEIVATVDLERLSVSIVVMDENNNRVFDTSTERLNKQSFPLSAGERLQATFELDLHLAPGTYRIGVYVYRYDIEKMYDLRLPAATIHVKSEVDFKGVVNLYPKATIKTIGSNSGTPWADQGAWGLPEEASTG